MSQFDALGPFRGLHIIIQVTHRFDKAATKTVRDKDDGPMLCVLRSPVRGKHGKESLRDILHGPHVGSGPDGPVILEGQKPGIRKHFGQLIWP